MLLSEKLEAEIVDWEKCLLDPELSEKQRRFLQYCLKDSKEQFSRIQADPGINMEVDRLTWP